MADKKRGLKVTLFLFLIFFILSAAFAVWINNFYQNAKNKIKKEQLKTECTSYNYKVNDVDCSGNKLSFQIYNGKTSGIVHKLNVVSGNNSQIFTFEGLDNNQNEYVVVDNILENNTFYVYVEDCEYNKILVGCEK